MLSTDHPAGSFRKSPAVGGLPWDTRSDERNANTLSLDFPPHLLGQSGQPFLLGLARYGRWISTHLPVSISYSFTAHFPNPSCTLFDHSCRGFPGFPGWGTSLNCDRSVEKVSRHGVAEGGGPPVQPRSNLECRWAPCGRNPPALASFPLPDAGTGECLAFIRAVTPTTWGLCGFLLPTPPDQTAD